MKGLVLMHLSRNTAHAKGPEFVDGLRRRIEESLERKEQVYNFPHWSSPAEFLDEYRNKAEWVEYRKGWSDILLQMMDGKLRMVKDEIQSADLCGQCLSACVRDFGRMLGADSEAIFPPASEVGWDIKLYQRVRETKIPSNPLYDLSI